MQLSQSYHRTEYAELEGKPLFETNWYLLYLMQFSFSNSVRFETYFAHLPKDSSQPPGTYTHKTGSEEVGQGNRLSPNYQQHPNTHSKFCNFKNRRGKTHHSILALNSNPESWPARQCDSVGSAATPVTPWCSCAYTCFTTGIAHYPTSRLQPTTLTGTPTPQKKVTIFPLSLWFRLHCQKLHQHWQNLPQIKHWEVCGVTLSPFLSKAF